MKIKLILRLVAYNAEEERQAPPGATVKDLVEAYLSTCPPQARRMLVDEQSAKAAIYTLNHVGQQPQELEEAWIVYSLVREDGLSQIEAAELLGRHKSWVNRRLAMMERLADVAQEELRLGLLSPSMARQLTRLPAGNQVEALAAARAASLNSQELSGVVDLLLASSTGQQKPNQNLKVDGSGDQAGQPFPRCRMRHCCPERQQT